MSTSNDTLLTRITEFFVRSHDFNGILVSRLSSELDIDITELRQRLTELITAGEVELAFASNSENPHIKRIASLPIDSQIAKLRGENPATICAYPHPHNATQRADSKALEERPFTLRLAHAEAQLTPVFFELAVLERYFRDPRYRCWFGDREGTISIDDEHYLSDATADRDKISLQTFGIGYDKARSRVVVVFLRYLAHLSAEHQQYWKAHAVSDPCSMNSDYERASIWGEWPKFNSAYEAFIEEQVEINKLALLIGGAVLFNKTFEGEDRPVEFSSMLRPTLRSFYDFVHTLDKMLSENINRDFFRGKVPMDETVGRQAGRVEVRTHGTIMLLKLWLSKVYKNADGQDVSEEIVAAFKEVRKQRQPTAHALLEDRYDLSYPGQQDKLLERAIHSLQRLRWVFMSHPKTKGHATTDWLDGDKIVFF